MSKITITIIDALNHFSSEVIEHIRKARFIGELIKDLQIEKNKQFGRPFINGKQLAEILLDHTWEVIKNE